MVKFLKEYVLLSFLILRLFSICLQCFILFFKFIQYLFDYKVKFKKDS